MTAFIRVAALTMLMLPAIASAQQPGPFVGSWEGAIVHEGGELPIVVSFLEDGASLTGVVLVSGLELYVKDGRITNDGVEFTSPRLRETDRDVPYSWTGNRVDDVITFSVVAQDREGPSFDLTLKKQATGPR